MSKIIWDQVGQKTYETGVNCGVLYPQALNGLYPKGVPWNGLTTVTESPSGAEAKASYADNMKYLNMVSNEEFAATVEAYTYPDEFGACDGSAEISAGVKIAQQKRSPFGMSYKSKFGNDVSGNDYGYKLHIIYGALAAPSEKAYATENDSSDAITFSWALTTTPVSVTGFKPTASITIDSTKVDKDKLAALELILYGNTGVDPRLPLPDEIASIFGTDTPAELALSSSVPVDAASAVSVTDNIVLTFNNKIAGEAITLTTAAGVNIPVNKTFDGTGKVLTIDPVSSLSASTTYLVVIAGVTDIYAHSLSTVIRHFVTA